MAPLGAGRRAPGPLSRAQPLGGVSQATYHPLCRLGVTVDGLVQSEPEQGSIDELADPLRPTGRYAAAGEVCRHGVGPAGVGAPRPRTQGFSNLSWTALVLVGYAVSIWLLAEIVQTLPNSVTYAIWSGARTALVAAVGLVAIVVGAVLLNLQA